MDSENKKILNDLLSVYQTECANEAKTFRNGIESGETVSMYSLLIKNIQRSNISVNDKLFHSLKLIYFLNYCLNYDNGIPFIEILNSMIDNSEKQIVVNAVQSQKTLINFLSEQGIDLDILRDYVDNKEIVEYAIDTNKKSTGVLQRILARKQENKSEIDQSNIESENSKKHKDGYNSKEWCTILYFSDYANKQLNQYDTEIIKAFHIDQELPFAVTTFIQNFKTVKKHIEKNEAPAVRLINKILPYFSKDKKNKKYIENQLSIINDEIDRK